MPYLPNIRSSSSMQIEETNNENANAGAETDWIRWTTKIFNEESGSIDSNIYKFYFEFF